MNTLQAVPTLTQTQKNHAPYLQKRRVIKRSSSVVSHIFQIDQGELGPRWTG